MRTGGIIMNYDKCREVNMVFEKVGDIKHWIDACIDKHNNYLMIIVRFARPPRSQESEFCDIYGEVVEELPDR